MLEFTLESDGYSKEIKMESSLVAIAKWESVFKVPFFSITKFTPEQFIFYVECMLIDCELTSVDYTILNENHVILINDYMNDTRTATYVKPSGNTSSITLTSEIIYAYMALAGVDWDCENWHINRLLKLLEVVSELQGEKKPMSQNDIVQERIRINNERRAKYKSKG